MRSHVNRVIPAGIAISMAVLVPAWRSWPLISWNSGISAMQAMEGMAIPIKLSLTKVDSRMPLVMTISSASSRFFGRGVITDNKIPVVASRMNNVSARPCTQIVRELRRAIMSA